MKTVASVLVSVGLVLPGSAATFTVMNTNDSGTGSLRQAILEANVDTAEDLIAFDIPGSGRRVIQLLAALPFVGYPVVIDGFTQPGSSANTLSNQNNANWLIELDGRSAGANSDGLGIENGITIRGLRIANFNGFGIDVSGDNCVMAGCFIYSNRLGGVRLDEADQCRVGGPAPADRNVISGNLGPGIIFDDDGAANQILGNFIGTDGTGIEGPGNQGWGIHIAGLFGETRIGGTNSGEANAIAFNSLGGVWVQLEIAWNHSIRANRIWSNGGLGIDLGFFPGLSTNDAGDGDDFGANHLQNFPILTNAVIHPTNTVVQGRLNSRPNVEHAVDFYANTECDPSGHGEGEVYLGSARVTTDGNGNAAFEVILPPTSRREFTATATDPLGNTSEFSPCLLAAISVATLAVVNTNDSGAGSLRQAILDSNLDTSPEVIVFNIPGVGVRTIQLLSELPGLTGPATLDGFTQPGASANTLTNGNNANWLIALDGTLAGASEGLRVHSNVTVRGLRVSHFQRAGLFVHGVSSVVAGCLITSNQLGIAFDDDAADALIGGAAVADRNVISGNFGSGIVLQGGATHRVLGNWIGTDLTGTTSMGNHGWAIHNTDLLSETRIGGTNSGEANVMAFNSAGGVWLQYDGSNNPVRGNFIFSNGGLGIDLGFLPGVSTNDPGDADAGVNHGQNFPLLTNAIINAAATTVGGRLHSRSNTIYALDFYANAECDASGHGEGELYLGSASITTDAGGNANFQAMVAPAGTRRYFTATATDPFGNTSEFSPCWPQPLRLEFANLFDQGLELILRTVDGTPVSSERLPGLRVLAATNLSPPAVWTPLPNALELTNGLVRVPGLTLTNGARFFRSAEGE